jgi:putative addiction module CopG family antidote
MNLSLKPQIEKFINEQIKAGHYSSATEVLEEAVVRMMEESAGLDEDTLAAIDRSEDQIKRGKYQDWRKVSRELRTEYLRE